MVAKFGHHPNRWYRDQDGDVHLNNASFFNSDEVDLAPGLNDAPVRVQNTQLTDAQVRAMAATPIVVVAAPTDGTANVLVAVHIVLGRPTNSYDDAAADGNINFIYASGADGSAGLDDIEADTFIDAAADAARYITAQSPVGEVTPVADATILIDNDGAEFTSAADTTANTLSIRAYFRNVPMVAFS